MHMLMNTVDYLVITSFFDVLPGATLKLELLMRTVKSGKYSIINIHVGPAKFLPRSKKIFSNKIYQTCVIVKSVVQKYICEHYESKFCVTEQAWLIILIHS